MKHLATKGWKGPHVSCTTYQVDATRSTLLMRTIFHDSFIAYRYCLCHGAGLKDCRPLYHTSTLHRTSKPSVPAFVLSFMGTFDESNERKECGD